MAAASPLQAEVTAPAEESLAPVAEAPVPVVEPPALAEESPAPAEEPSAPAPETTATAEETPVPAAEAPAAAEEKEEDVADLGEIVVTAARRKSSWKDAPAMVTVVDREELQRAPEKTVDDFLKRIPSVSYSRIHAAECGPGRDITLRGIHEQKRTLVLVDGVPMNDGVNGSVNWSMIPKESVERIEIVRGPMSALYGSGAMGGVINIITRKPREPNETTLKGGYGSLNTYTATLLQGGRFEKGGYFIGGNLLKTDGYVQVKEKKDYHVKNARTDMSLLGSFFVFPDDRSTLTLNVNYVNEDFSRGLQTDEQNNASARLSLSYERELKNNANLTATAYAHLLWREVDLGARPDYVKHDHTEFDDVVKVGQLFQTDFRVAGFNTLTVGVDSHISVMDKHNKYALVERKAKASGEQIQASLFAEDEMKFTSDKHKFLLTPGLRVDYNRSGEGKSSDTNPGPNPPVDEDYPDRAFVAVNPKLSMVYRYADRTTVRASAGRSFAAPTLFELYTVFTRGPMLMYGNPDLDPESAWSAEIGVDQWFMKNLLGRVTGYFTRGENFIGSRLIAENQWQMDNITTVQALGLDAELRYDIDEMWALYGGYNFNWSTVFEDEADSSIEGNHLPFEPKHRARLGVVFRYKKWIVADFSARYEGERFVDFENTQESKLGDYFSLDLALSGTIVEHLRWQLTFENMLNEKYDIYSVPTDPAEAPGILVNGALILDF